MDRTLFQQLLTQDRSMLPWKGFSLFLLLAQREGAWYFVLEKRSAAVTQPGELCFPGGRIEAGESPEAAAFRELEEEIGVAREAVDYLGPLPALETPWGGRLHAFLGLLKEADFQDYRLDPSETERLFFFPWAGLPADSYQVPLTLRLPEDFPVDRIPGGKDYPFRARSEAFDFYRLDGEWVWGLTARILSWVLRRKKALGLPER